MGVGPGTGEMSKQCGPASFRMIRGPRKEVAGCGNSYIIIRFSF